MVERWLSIGRCLACEPLRKGKKAGESEREGGGVRKWHTFRRGYLVVQVRLNDFCKKKLKETRIRTRPLGNP